MNYALEMLFLLKSMLTKNDRYKYFYCLINTMALDVIIDIHPERILNKAELVDIILKIQAFEGLLNCSAGVVVKQNRQLGSSYRVVSDKDAENGIKNPGKSEWYLQFFPRSYFEQLRERYIH